MAKKFYYDAEASKQAAEKATSRGGNVNKFKMEADKVKLLIVGAAKKGQPAVFTTIIHETWGGTKKQWVYLFFSPL